MNKLNFLLLTILVSLLSTNSFAAPKVYGKINIAADDGNGTDDYVNNASRLGVKGTMDLKNGLTGIYKVEYEIDPTDGKAQDEQTVTLGTGETVVTKSAMIAKQRNTFVGLKGDWGTVKLGFHDTYLKLAQGKVDLFNDLRGDIKTTFSGEDRTSDFLGYESPVFGGGFQFKYNLSDGGSAANGGTGNRDAKAYSISYKTKKIYAAYASEENSTKSSGEDHTRIVIQVPIGPVKIGFIDQESEIGTSKDDSTMFNIAWKATDNLTVKFQTMDKEDENGITQDDVTSFGIDYKLAKKVKLFFYDTEHEDGVISISNQPKDYTGIGIEFKF